MQILSQTVNKWIDDYVVKIDRSHFSIKKAGMADDAVASEGIASFFRTYSIRFDQNHVLSLIKRSKRTSGTFLLPGGWRYVCGKNAIEFFKGKTGGKRVFFSCEIPLSGTAECRQKNVIFNVEKFRREGNKAFSFSDPTVAYLDARHIEKPLVYRPWKMKDAFWPYGEKGYKELNGFLKKQKLSKDERRSTGVVAVKGGTIVWIPGLRIHHRFRITEATREILKISCKTLV